MVFVDASGVFVLYKKNILYVLNPINDVQQKYNVLGKVKRLLMGDYIIFISLL